MRVGACLSCGVEYGQTHKPWCRFERFAPLVALKVPAPRWAQLSPAYVASALRATLSTDMRMS